MIKRYTKQEIGGLWTDYQTYYTWLQVELAVCEAWVELGEIPQEVVEEIKNKALYTLSVDRIHTIEKEVKHNVIAFLTHVAELVGDNSRFIHKGLTSSDVLDTSLSIQTVSVANILIGRMQQFEKVLKQKAFEHKNTIMMGRSHGMHAEPTTFGLKLANWYSEMRRNRERLIDARECMRCGKISGAVGTYAHIPPELEEITCKKLGLIPAAISNQILQRDRHAQFITTLAIIGSSLEKFATEIRHLARTEIHEVEEPFTKKQKGSSAMPHKRNPIRTENICGCSRVLRGYALTAMENITLWHERDISHSSAERIIFPDATILLYHMLTKMINVVENMQVYPKNMQNNISLTNGVYTSQKIMLLLTENGILREEAYKIVQKCAMESMDRGEFRVLLKKHVSPEMYEIISKDFEDEDYLKNVDYTFDQVFGGEVKITWAEPPEGCFSYEKYFNKSLEKPSRQEVQCEPLKRTYGKE